MFVCIIPHLIRFSLSLTHLSLLSLSVSLSVSFLSRLY